MLSRRLLSLASASTSRASVRALHASRAVCAESDPFPLPFDPALLAQQQRPRHDQAEAEMAQWQAIQPIKRVGEDDNKMRARLVYQTRKRGMLENDLLLSTFAKNELPSMTREQMEEFDKVGLRRGLVQTSGISLCRGCADDPSFGQRTAAAPSFMTFSLS